MNQLTPESQNKKTIKTLMEKTIKDRISLITVKKVNLQKVLDLYPHLFAFEGEMVCSIKANE